VHGHAHKGSPEGKTSGGIPVYNVAVPVLRAAYPDRPPFRVIEVPREHVPDDSASRPHGRRATDREPVASRVAEQSTSDAAAN